jgi:hypothetical protein
VKLLFLLIFLTYAHANDVVRGQLARPPYSRGEPEIILIENGEFKKSAGKTIIESSLARLQSEYKIRINQEVLAGYILNLDDSDANNIKGFDLDAYVDLPFFKPWFHNPYPGNNESDDYTESLWKYAMSAPPLDSAREKEGDAVAYTHIDHVYFSLGKFNYGFYVNAASGKSNNAGFESVLHEALHIWHFRNLERVTALLKSPGGYFDRARESEKICKDFAEVSLGDTELPGCGFDKSITAMKTILEKIKWPQRYGYLAKRKIAVSKDSYGCSSLGPETIIEGQTYCLIEKTDSYTMGDMHAFDNETEYFAILMQLYVFSPEDFKRVATKVEQEFASRLFSETFR